LIFRICTQRLEFRALDRVQFPPDLAGNVFRGAFGSLSSPELFRPRLANGPSGFADPPRPFVFRAQHLNGRTIERGESFFLDVNLFQDIRAPFIAAFEELLDAGLGSTRARVELLPSAPPSHTCIDLTEAIPTTACTVFFRTPTDLKGALFTGIRDRVSTLSSLYGAGTPDIDFKGMSERGAAIRPIKTDLRHSDVSRRSSRTGQVHGIGGFTGAIEYEGDLTEFVPFLRAGFWTGVGRHTVWGNGVIELAGRR
jgi:hypothetical protein